MFKSKITRIIGVVGALGALALGGSALADAASNSTSSGKSQAASSKQDRHDQTTPGGHVGTNGKTEQALSASDAAKVKAAAEKKIPSGKVLRVETDVDHGSPFEAHVQKSDGSQVEVLVDSGFQVTAVNAMGGHGGPGGHDGDHDSGPGQR